MMILLSQDKAFYDDFEAMAAQAVARAQKLLDLAAAGPDGREYILAIREHEHLADEIAHKSLRRLDRAFETPFWREDIHDLVLTLDSIIDTVKATADRFEAFHLGHVSLEFTRQVQTLVSAVIAVEQTMRHMRKDRRLPSLLKEIIAIHEQENQANDIHEGVMSDFFGKSENALLVLKWKELHDLVVRATDACEDVANIVERIAVRNF